MRFDPLSTDEFRFEHSYIAFSGAQPDVMVGDVDRWYPYMSVTKPIAAWAVLVAVYKGYLRLDDPAGPPGSTFRHLLAHASGLPPAHGEPIARPGRRRIYSNYGYDVLAHEVQQRIGMNIHDWISRSVFAPLGMDAVECRGSIAYSARGTADSLMRFGLEILNPTCIPAELAEEACTVQFPKIAGITPGYGSSSDNPWGLGFSIRNPDHPHWTGPSFSDRVVGHFGMSGSFIYVDLIARKAGVFLGEKEFCSEHIRLWPALTNEMWQNTVSQ
ncbi:serine hydrolase domain-containing protein [Trueperella sp. LYQ143]|uniref:serine hydrolase domain-containing protein n=1 Tax=Trueperella sp. LYQ143 TaxID=3391059 RepID=UPI0039835375